MVRMMVRLVVRLVVRMCLCLLLLLVVRLWVVGLRVMPLVVLGSLLGQLKSRRRRRRTAIVLHLQPIDHLLHALQLRGRVLGLGHSTTTTWLLHQRGRRGGRHGNRSSGRRMGGGSRSWAGAQTPGAILHHTAATQATGRIARSIGIRARSDCIKGGAQAARQAVRREAMALQALQGRDRRVSRRRIGVAKEGRMLGGQRQLGIEQQSGIQAGRTHGRRRCRIVQQAKMRRRIEAVGIQVRQQMRRRMDGRTHRYIRRWVATAAGIQASRCGSRCRAHRLLGTARRGGPKGTAGTAADAFRAARIAAIPLHIGIRLQATTQCILRTGIGRRGSCVLRGSGSGARQVVKPGSQGYK